MVRKKRTHSDDSVRPQSLSRPADAHGLVEYWMDVIRKRMPSGSRLSATVQLKPKLGYLASFKLSLEGETLSSEARDENADEAVKKAGLGLCQHLPESEGALEGWDISQAS